MFSWPTSISLGEIGEFMDGHLSDIIRQEIVNSVGTDTPALTIFRRQGRDNDEMKTVIVALENTLGKVWVSRRRIRREALKLIQEN